MRVFFLMKSIRTLMRWSGSIVSAVAMKLAKRPASISTLAPSLKLFGGNNAPHASHLSMRLEISWKGSCFSLPSKLTSLETPIVSLIVRHRASSVQTLTDSWPRKRGVRSLTKREAFLRVVFCMRRNVANSCLCKLRSARRWLFSLNFIKYQWLIAPPGLSIRSLLSNLNDYLKIEKSLFWIAGIPYLALTSIIHNWELSFRIIENKLFLPLTLVKFFACKILISFWDSRIELLNVLVQRFFLQVHEYFRLKSLFFFKRAWKYRAASCGTLPKDWSWWADGKSSRRRSS